MDLSNINEQGSSRRTQSPKPAIARRKGEIGAVMIDPKTGKPIPDTWVPKAEVPEKALKYLDPAKFAAAEKRNKDRQAQIDAERERLKGVGNPPGVPSSASEPPKQQPPRRQPAPPAQPSPVAKYMAAAAAARKIQDPVQRAAEMEKVKQSGMEIWKAKYKDTLAKKVSPTGQQLGTGQSEMAKQAAELRALRPVRTPEAPVNQSSVQPAAQPAPSVKTDTAVQRVQAAQKPIPPVKSFDTTRLQRKLGTTQSVVSSSYEPESDMVEAFPSVQGTLNPWESPLSGKSGIKIRSTSGGETKEYGPLKGGSFIKQPPLKGAKKETKPMTVAASYEYEPYELVLEYLLSEGHADTVEEAHYVMMQMDAEHIQDIVEMGDPSFPIKRSTGAGALTPDAAKQLGPKAVELQKQKAGQVALPKLPPA